MKSFGRGNPKERGSGTQNLLVEKNPRPKKNRRPQAMKKAAKTKCRKCELLSLSLAVSRDTYSQACAQLSSFRQERAAFVRFFNDIDLILAASADTLCGSKWINAAALLEARKRYAEAMEKL